MTARPWLVDGSSTARLWLAASLIGTHTCCLLLVLSVCIDNLTGKWHEQGTYDQIELLKLDPRFLEGGSLFGKNFGKCKYANADSNVPLSAGARSYKQRPNVWQQIFTPRVPP